MKNVGDAGFSRKRGGNAGSGPPLPDTVYKKTNFKKVGFSTTAFTAKILSWRFRHLDIVGCFLKRRPTKGGSRAPQAPPLATPLTMSSSTPRTTTEITTRIHVINCRIHYVINCPNNNHRSNNSCYNSIYVIRIH